MMKIFIDENNRNIAVYDTMHEPGMVDVLKSGMTLTVQEFCDMLRGKPAIYSIYQSAKEYTDAKLPTMPHDDGRPLY